MCKPGVARAQVLGVEVILVVVGHQQRVDAAQVQAEPQRVAVRVGRKVDQQLVVDQRARAGAWMFLPPFSRARRQASQLQNRAGQPSAAAVPKI